MSCTHNLASPRVPAVAGNPTAANPRAPALAGFADGRKVELHQLEDWVNLDRPSKHRGGILGCPRLRVGAVLAVEDEEAVEPRSRRVHGSVSGVRVSAVDGDAERRC